MRRLAQFSLLFGFGVLAACHGTDPATGGAGSSASAPQTTPSAVKAGSGSGDTKVATPAAPADAAPAKEPEKPAVAAKEPPPLSGHDFTVEAKQLLAVGACGEGQAPAGFDDKLLAAHCEVIKQAQADYMEKWVKPAETF